MTSEKSEQEWRTVWGFDDSAVETVKANEAEAKKAEEGGQGRGAQAEEVNPGCSEPNTCRPEGVRNRTPDVLEDQPRPSRSGPLHATKTL